MRASWTRGEAVSTAAWVTAALFSAALAAPARASCPGPRTQLGCGEGATVSPGCAVAAYLGQGETPSAVVVGTGGDAGAPVAITLSAPETIKVEGHDPYYDPQTCELKDGTYFLPYLRVLLTPKGTWPLDQTLQVTAGGAAIGSFRATSSGSCGDQRPTAGMCGSGAPAPVPGCPKTTESGGCSSGGAPTCPWLLVAALAGLAVLAGLLRSRLRA